MERFQVRGVQREKVTARHLGDVCVGNGGKATRKETHICFWTSQ